MIAPEHPAEAFAANHDAVAGADAIIGLDQLAPAPLVIPFAVIVGDALANRATQRPFAGQYHPVEAPPP